MGTKTESPLHIVGEQPTSNETIVDLELDSLEPHPANRRVGGFDQTKLEQLASSIEAIGVQQPIVVRPMRREDLHSWMETPDARYEIVAGERRWRASKIAGKARIPCVVRELDDVTALEIQTVENLQREDIHPLDEADGYTRLIEQAGYDVEHVAAELGKSPSYVYQRLQLQKLIDAARKLLEQGEITAGHAILIARLRSEDQQELVKYIRERRRWSSHEVISVRELDAHIHDMVLLDLARVPWKRSDAKLLAAAGACTVCPKRTAAQSELFADVCKSKHDYCLDADCFQAKADAFLAAQSKKLAPQKPVLLIGKGADHGQVQHAPKEILRSYSYTECASSDKNAVRALVVVGPDRGRATWIRRNAEGGDPASDQFQAKQLAANKKRQRENAARKAVYDAVIAVARDEALANGVLHPAAVRFIADEFFGRLSSNYRRIILCELGWTEERGSHPKELTVAGDSDVFALLLRCALIDHVEASPYAAAPSKPLYKMAALYGVDAKAIEARTLTRLSVKNKAKGVKDDGKVTSHDNTGKTAAVRNGTDSDAPRSKTDLRGTPRVHRHHEFPGT